MADDGIALHCGLKYLSEVWRCRACCCGSFRQRRNAPPRESSPRREPTVPPTDPLASLVAAGLAFYGPRLRVDKLAALRRPGAIGAFGYGFIFSLGTSAAPLLLLLAVSAAQASFLYGLLLAFAPSIWALPRMTRSTARRFS